MPAAAGGMRRPVRNQLGVRVFRTSVAKQRLRGSDSACDAFFETALEARWPHRASVAMCFAAATRLLHGHDNAHRKPTAPRSAGPLVPWRCWAAAAVWSGPRAAESRFVSRSAQPGGAGKPARRFARGEFGLCDPRRSAHHHRRIGAPDICRPHASVLAAGSERSEGMSRDGFPDRGSRPWTASAAAARFEAGTIAYNPPRLTAIHFQHFADAGAEPYPGRLDPVGEIQ